ncbi:hypothetical protein TEH11_1971 [Tetragenococcus halophilus subsp. halophilus]|uniref:restriction endonuclease subunit S n=1 Tax=Tetragenococcus halophilus TaxID=51669 RepID=UPI000CC1D85C|nr:restriction endonuclease subunit S [Tetragenococcus halophilus]GBD62288.1 hypothetical protein TEH11_1971 [Tetragenococcus halophilus subsp. halophilus]
MSKEEKRAPEVRFEGFHDDWKQRKLGDHAIIKGRLGWKNLKQEEYLPTGPNMIAGRHISDGMIDWKKVNHIPEWRYEESPEIMLENGDIIFTKDGSLGNPALVTYLPDKSTINSTMMLVRTDDTIDSGFFYQILQSKQFQKLIYLKVSGSSVPHLFQADMNKFYFFAPTVYEQKMLNALLSKIEVSIALHQRKLEQLRDFKKAALQFLFPQTGETEPKVRFANFNDIWKQRKLNEVGSNISDGDWIEKKHIFSQGEYRIIQTGNLGEGVFLDKKSNAKYLYQKDFDELKANEIFPGDLLISRLAEPAGRTIILPDINYKMVTSVDVTIIRKDDKKFDSTFFMSQMNWLKTLHEISKKVTGTSHKRISRKNLEKTLLAIPSLEEQNKIGFFFKQIDDTIAFYQAKLVKLQDIKKAFLQKLFI